MAVPANPALYVYNAASLWSGHHIPVWGFRWQPKVDSWPAVMGLAALVTPLAGCCAATPSETALIWIQATC